MNSNSKQPRSLKTLTSTKKIIKSKSSNFEQPKETYNNELFAHWGNLILRYNNVKKDDIVTHSNKRYKIKKFLGKGGFKAAYLANQIGKNQDFVIFYPVIKNKKIVNNKTFLDFPDIQKITDKFSNEIDRLEHYFTKFQNKCVSDIICPIYLSKQELVIITSYFKGTELTDYIKSNPKIKINDTIKIMINICNALKQLHDKGIVHRDLKPSNIMINNKKKIYLIDLGISCDIPDCPGSAGTIGYLPPETSVQKSYEWSIDVWALGCIFFELITNSKLFKPEKKNNNSYSWTYLYNSKYRQQLMNILEQRFFYFDSKLLGYKLRKTSTHALIFKLLRDMLSLDYTTRPTVDQILNALKEIKKLL